MARILLVENDVLLRNMYQLKLEKDDHVVIEAANGEEAHRVIATAQPDIIVLDLMLPVKDGFTFLSEIKAKKKWAHTPVLVITALEQEEDRAVATNLGVTDYLIKYHATAEEVRERVNAILKERKHKKK